MVDLQENCDAGNVIDDGIIFAPLLGSGPDDGVSRLLRTVLDVERPHDLCNSFVWQEFPNSVTRYDDEFIFRLKFKSHDLGICCNTDWMCDVVTKRSTHSKSRRVLLHQPHSHRSEILSHCSLDCVNTTIHGEDSLLLDWHTRFMVFTQRRYLYTTLRGTISLTIALRIWKQDSSWVSGISAEYDVSIEEYGNTSWTTKLCVVFLPGEYVMNLMESSI